MPYGTGKFVTVWKIEDKGKYSDVQISSSSKNKEGKYETDFTAIARFIGHAHNKLSQIKLKDLIKLVSCEVKNKYDKEKKVITYTNYAVFDFEPFNANSSTAPATKQDEPNVSIEDPDEMPFN